ncbi:MAG: hypothetical protein Q7T55_15055, partial [Solirubrobacteraceae bacterium]|nr:hypothetical protein [Solirubrobacteraceae bacterium]
GGTRVPRKGTVFVSVRESDKTRILDAVKLLSSAGFRVLATGGTQRYLVDNGVPENLAQFIFNVSLATARKDAISHIVPANVLVNNCVMVATTPQPGCVAKFDAEASGDNQLKSSQMKSFLARQKAIAAAQPKGEKDPDSLLPPATTTKEAGR